MKPELTIIIPVYNEEQNLLRVQQVFEKYFLSAKVASRVIFINDGSYDNSLQVIRNINNANSLFRYISFDKN